MSIEIGDQVLVARISHPNELAPRHHLRIRQIGRVVSVISPRFQWSDDVGYELEFSDGVRLKFFATEVAKTTAQELIDVHQGR